MHDSRVISQNVQEFFDHLLIIYLFTDEFDEIPRTFYEKILEYFINVVEHHITVEKEMNRILIDANIQYSVHEIL